jgi:hypothetical protein
MLRGKLFLELENAAEFLLARLECFQLFAELIGKIALPHEKIFQFIQGKDAGDVCLSRLRKLGELDLSLLLAKQARILFDPDFAPPEIISAKVQRWWPVAPAR